MGGVIALLGATGRIGRHVAAELADRPVEVRALVRRPGTARLPVGAVRADLRDPASVHAALEGAERLLLVTPHGPDQDLLEAAAIEAARAAGVRRVVKVSGGAATLGPNGPTPTGIAHWRGEQRLERSGLGFTFLRPSMFQQGVLDLPRPGGRLLVSPLGPAPIAMVDLRDVAACAAAALLDPAPADGAWQLTGPRAVTLGDVARSLGARHVRVPRAAVARVLRRRGATAWEAEHAARMSAFFATGADSTPTDHVLRLTGRSPRPVEALLHEHLTTQDPN